MRILGVVALLWSGIAAAIVPVTRATPTYTLFAVNNGPGDQFDPHVNGNLMVYTSSSSSPVVFATIHYFDFSTMIDTQIPIADSVEDLLPSTDGRRITFSRIRSDGTQNIEVFDPVTQVTMEVDSRPGPTAHTSPAIAGNTVAYIDQTDSLLGELVVADLTNHTSQQLTRDAEIDQNPSVSPDGSLVVWEHCDSTNYNCDVWQAQKSGTSWTVSSISSDPANEAYPHTNGSIIAYNADRPTLAESDIFFRPIGGGYETQIELPGRQLNPHVAGQFIAFENDNSGGYGDIWLYDTSTNTLYPVTNTPALSEELDDITVLADGSVRLVWDRLESAAGTGFNVYSATFKVPSQIADACDSSAPLDNFNRPNGSLGGNWRGLTSAVFYRIANERLDVQTGGPIYWNPSVFDVNQAAFVTLSAIDSKSPSQGLLLKAQTGDVPAAGAIAVVYDATAAAVRVSTLRLGALTWTPYGNTPAPFSNGDKLGACARDDGEVRVYRNDSLLTTVNLNAADQAFFNGKGGKIGLWSIAAPNAVFDNFGGGSVAP